jgi:hypothetical protein
MTGPKYREDAVTVPPPKSAFRQAVKYLPLLFLPARQLAVSLGRIRRQRFCLGKRPASTENLIHYLNPQCTPLYRGFVTLSTMFL